METILELMQDTDNALPVEALVAGIRTEKGDALRITLPAPHREIIFNRAEFLRALGVAWRLE